MINKSIKINSSSNLQIIDITYDIKRILDEINSDIKSNNSNQSNDSNKSNNSIQSLNGILNVFSKHSTSAIVINENEHGLLADFEKILKDLVPESNNYKHDRIDNNAASHIRAFLLGSSETIPIIDGKLDLGTWQSIFFIELDGPRANRTVDLVFIVE